MKQAYQKNGNKKSAPLLEHRSNIGFPQAFNDFEPPVPNCRNRDAELPANFGSLVAFFHEANKPNFRNGQHIH
jgi:hypothetical protein